MEHVRNPIQRWMGLMGARSNLYIISDGPSRNVRQNERKLFMESEQDILAMAKKCGFSPVGKIVMENDEHQAIYILS